MDYAHKPGALEKVLLSAREVTSGRVILVFGAGGDRDRAKRPVMGEIAARLADRVVVTSDNPRSELPEAIIDEIYAGIPEGSRHVERLADRRAAIRRAIALAQPGDVVVIAGKGHEQGQEFAPRPQGAVRRRRGRARGADAPVRHWTDQRIAGAAGAELVRGVDDRSDAGPARVVIDSRAVAPGDLFVAIPGERVDGGQFAADALRAGAWGVLAQPSGPARRRRPRTRAS